MFFEALLLSVLMRDVCDGDISLKWLGFVPSHSRGGTKPSHSLRSHYFSVLLLKEDLWRFCKVVCAVLSAEIVGFTVIVARN